MQENAGERRIQTLIVTRGDILLFYSWFKKIWESSLKRVKRELLSFLKSILGYLDKIFGAKAKNVDNQILADTDTLIWKYLIDIENSYKYQIQTFSLSRDFFEIRTCFDKCKSLYDLSSFKRYQKDLSSILVKALDELYEECSSASERLNSSVDYYLKLQPERRSDIEINIKYVLEKDVESILSSIKKIYRLIKSDRIFK
jgi:hypothetical protein